MLLSDIKNEGIVQVLNRLTTATVNIYPFKSKMTDLNEALDWYFGLAFKSDGQWNFDDIGNSSPPIDTQDLVSGTNKYKISSFSDKILNILKLEILNGSGIGQILTPERLESLGLTPLGVNQIGYTSGVIGSGYGNSFEQLYGGGVPSGTPTNYVKFGDYIYLRPKPNYNSTGGLKAYVDRQATKFNFVAATVTIAVPGVFTSVAHGLALNDTVILETDGALPTGLAPDTQYYVVAGGLTADAFELSATLGGTAITTTGSQSGNHAFLKTNATPGIIAPHHIMLCRKAALTYLNYTNSFKVGSLPQQVQQDEQTIMSYFANRGRDIKPKLVTQFQDNR